MTRLLRIYLLLIAVCLQLFCPGGLCAQNGIGDIVAQSDTLSRMSRFKKEVKKKGSLLYRFIKEFDSYDTTYIAPNYYNYTAMLQNTNYIQNFRLSGTAEDKRTQSITVSPETAFKVGPYFGWRWIFLGYTFDVGSPRSMNKSTEFSFRLYSSMLGFDFISVRNKGNFKIRRTKGFEGIGSKDFKGEPFTGMSAATTSFSAYYVSNYRHFSYPAAYNQSTMQLKSCGSPMLGFGFSKQNIDFDYTRLPAGLIGSPDVGEKIIDELKFRNINYRYYYLSAGYAYNWAFARNWLLGLSMMPSVGIRKMKGQRIQGNEIFMDLKNFSFDCTARSGIVWNNSHWFAGASYIQHLYLYNKKHLKLANSVNYVNIYFGFFFHRKRQYRSQP